MPAVRYALQLTNAAVRWRDVKAEDRAIPHTDAEGQPQAKGRRLLCLLSRAQQPRTLTNRVLVGATSAPRLPPRHRLPSSSSPSRGS